MMKDLNDIYFKRLQAIIPAESYDQVIGAHSAPLEICIRINTLKTTEEVVLKELKARGIKYFSLEPLSMAWRLEGVDLKDLGETELIKAGHIYIQNPSSMLCAMVLDPQPGERVLDMCAAPGSKATHLAAAMHNQGELICIEHVLKRYYKLKAVAKLMGAEVIHPRVMDARRYRDPQLFDRILLDAPCSSEGRIRTFDKKSFKYWSLRKIREMRRKQKGLVLNAGRLLKLGGTLVYATCTFSPEENEGVVDWFLRKTANTFEMESVALKGVDTYPALESWQEKAYDAGVKKCLRILPDGIWGGFFIAKLKRIG